MEEFTEQQVNGAAVILDESSKLTVAPLHDETQIQTGPTSAEIANAHINGPAIGNFKGDIESTASEPETATHKTAHERADMLIALHKADNPPKKSARLALSVAAVAIMAGILLYFVIFR